MSVKDVIKKSVLESDMYNQAIDGSTILTIVVDLAVALLIGLAIYWIYKRFYRGVVYSKNYAISLVGMTVLTAMITLAISTNVVISLGMVGALSIVRYRTAIKEPLDLMYMFWAIASGIAVGASMYILVALSFGIMFILVLIFDKTNGLAKQYMMVVHYDGDTTGDEVLRLLGHRKYQVRTRMMRADSCEMTIQMGIKGGNFSFLEKIRDVDGVNDVSLIEFDGEYHG